MRKRFQLFRRKKKRYAKPSYNTDLELKAQLKELDLSVLALSTTTRKTLHNQKIYSVLDLVTRKPADLTSKRLSKNSLNEIHHALTARNLYLGMYPNPEDFRFLIHLLDSNQPLEPQRIEVDGEWKTRPDFDW